MQGQFSLSGIVKNKKTGKAVPFATISFNSSNKTADINGVFEIESLQPITTIEAAQIGYKKEQFPINDLQTQIVISLHPSNVENHTDIRAQQIIAMAISFKDDNNPSKKLNSYQFKGYNKLLVSANPDSIKVEFDTIAKRNFFGRRSQKIDSSLYKFKKIIDYRDLIQTEKASLFKYDGKHFQENVLGVKMSGLKKPIYEPTASYGHVGRTPYKESVTMIRNGVRTQEYVQFFGWELLDSVDMIKNAFGL